MEWDVTGGWAPLSCSNADAGEEEGSERAQLLFTQGCSEVS